MVVDEYERTLRPALLDPVRDDGYCWVMIGSLQAGRSFAQPEGRAAARSRTTPSSPTRPSSCTTSARSAAAGTRCRSASTGRSTTTRPSTSGPGRRSASTTSRAVNARRTYSAKSTDDNHRAPKSDHRHLARAIELAERGRGQVSPNPLVGAVLANRDGVIGEGFHRALGSPHAEVEAIRAADGHDLTGATLYVSLEPCCHQGRTPPCTDAIREAGIARVVVASDDPSRARQRARTRDSARRGRRGRARRR